MYDYHAYTPYAINPDANVGDEIHYQPSNGDVDSDGTLSVSSGNNYDILKVIYGDSFTFLVDDVDEVDAFYEKRTGLLIRSIEKDTSSGSQFEFSPYEVVIKASLIPFPFLGVIIGIIVIGISFIFRKQKK
jgi:hypothetical protein